MVISTPAAELAPGQVVRFSDGTPAENGDLTVAAVETRHGPFWDWVRVTWADGSDSDWRAWETLDVVTAGTVGPGRFPAAGLPCPHGCAFRVCAECARHGRTAQHFRPDGICPDGHRLESL